EGISVSSALAAKHPVIVVDYIGLGTEGTHHYLNRVEEGRSVLDAAKAVKNVEGSDIDDDTKLQLRGYSQGGQATASAMELAMDSPPKLNRAYPSSAAVPADLYDTVSKHSSVYTDFLLYGIDTYEEQSGVELSDHLNQKGLDSVKSASNQCTIEALVSH